MTGSSLPPRPPNDGSLTGGTWSFLKQTQQWMYKISAPAVSQTTSATVSNLFFYPFDATSGNLVATLPAANTVLGKVYVIKKTDASANTVTVTPTGSDKIDGAATYVLSTQYQTIYLISNGVSNWWIISTQGASVSNPVSTAYTATGAFTYTIPTGTNVLYFRIQAAGGGSGAGGNGSAVGGGGGGEYLEGSIPVAGIATVTGNVGTGSAGADGGTSSITVNGFTITAAAGLHGAVGGNGGAGGGRKGPAGGSIGAPGGTGGDAVAEGVRAISGAAGGGPGTSSGTNNGGPGGGSEEWSGGTKGNGVSSKAGGGGGGASCNGPGSPGTNGNQVGAAGNASTPTGYGSGAGGSGQTSSGSTAAVAGANGFVELTPL